MQENFILATTSGAVAENETERLQALTVKNLLHLILSIGNFGKKIGTIVGY